MDRFDKWDDLTTDERLEALREIEERRRNFRNRLKAVGYVVLGGAGIAFVERVIDWVVGKQG